MLLLIAHRGGLHDQRWFSVPFGWGAEPLLDAMRISYETVVRTEDVRAAVTGAVKWMNSMQAPVAEPLGGETLFLTRRGRNPQTENFPRAAAMKEK
jgi:sulfopyruvate decarboxylase TPP-binding subunit